MMDIILNRVNKYVSHVLYRYTMTFPVHNIVLSSPSSGICFFSDVLKIFFFFRLWNRNRLMLLPTNVLTDENYVTEVSHHNTNISIRYQLYKYII